MSRRLLLLEMPVLIRNVLNEALFELTHFNEGQHRFDAEFLLHPQYEGIQLLLGLQHQIDLIANVLTATGRPVFEWTLFQIDRVDDELYVPLFAPLNLDRDPHLKHHGEQRG